MEHYRAVGYKVLTPDNGVIECLHAAAAARVAAEFNRLESLLYTLAKERHDMVQAG